MAEHLITQLGLLDAVVVAQRRLLRARDVSAVTHALIDLVERLGGAVEPARTGEDVIHVDLAVGRGDPLVAVAPPGSVARGHLDEVLAAIVDDARAVAALLEDAPGPERDPLTGLLTEAAFREVVARAGPGDQLIAIGLQGAATLVETYGRARIDQVARILAEIVRDAIRPYDVAGRVGLLGVVVMILRPGVDEADALSLVIGTQWEQRRPIEVDLQTMVWTVDDDGGTAALDAAIASLRAPSGSRELSGG